MAWLAPADTTTWDNIKIVKNFNLINFGGYTMPLYTVEWPGLTQAAAIARVDSLAGFSVNGVFTVDSSSIPFRGGASITLRGFEDNGSLPANSMFKINHSGLQNIIFKTSGATTVNSVTATLTVTPSLQTNFYLTRPASIQWLSVGTLFSLGSERMNDAGAWRVVRTGIGSG